MILLLRKLSTYLAFLVNNYLVRKYERYSIIDHLFATHCYLCSTAITRHDKSRHLCSNCQSDLAHPYSACAICSLPITNLNNARCIECEKERPSFVRSTCATKYAFPANVLVSDLKFSNKRFLAQPMAKMITEKRLQSSRTKPDLICAVPSHIEKLRTRSFNQAELIASACARELSIRAECNLLIKTKATDTQLGLTKKQRQENLEGSFVVNPNYTLNGLHIAVIDDVMTTGTTLNYAAQCLIDSGAASVEVWAFARTPKM